jgi:hypothetical protein
MAKIMEMGSLFSLEDIFAPLIWSMRKISTIVGVLIKL